MLRTRLVYEGTRLDLSDQANAPWWLMSSGDEAAIKALHRDARPPRLAGRRAEDDGRHRVAPVARPLGHDHRQRLGHDRRAASSRALYPASAIAGTTTLSLGSQTISRAWPLAADSAGQLPAAGRRRRRCG